MYVCVHGWSNSEELNIDFQKGSHSLALITDTPECRTWNQQWQPLSAHICSLAGLEGSCILSTEPEPVYWGAPQSQLWCQCWESQGTKHRAPVLPLSPSVSLCSLVSSSLLPLWGHVDTGSGCVLFMTGLGSHKTSLLLQCVRWAVTDDQGPRQG